MIEGGKDQESLRKVLEALRAAKDGDFSAQLSSATLGLTGEIAKAFNEIADLRQDHADERVLYDAAEAVETKRRVLHDAAEVVETKRRVLHDAAEVVETKRRVLHDAAEVVEAKDRADERVTHDAAEAVKERERKEERVTHDAAEEKERETAREGSRRLATVLQDSNDAITVWDLKGRILAWNHGAALMYGFTENEALQMGIRRLTPPNMRAEQKELTRRLIAGELISSFETQRITKDGRILDVWLTVTGLVDSDGKQIGFAYTDRDITERKAAEVRLEHTLVDLER